MAKVKVLSNCVTVLGDLVASRTQERTRLHEVLLATIDRANERVPGLDPLRVTVGDEVQGVYPTLGDALRTTHLLRNDLFGTADMRFGVGGGDVRIIDEQRGIQDGNAWWLAREAIDVAEHLATQTGYSGVRTIIRDERAAALPTTGALVQLVDSSIAGLRAGSRRSLIGLLDGLDNAAVARAEGISESANSQRVQHNDLRVLADAIAALHDLP